MLRQGLVNEIRLKTKQSFAKVLRQHQAKSVAELWTPQVILISNGKCLTRDNLKTYNATKITSDQWYAYFKSEFSEPDPSLSNQYERELDDYLGQSIDEISFIVTLSAVTEYISKLQKKTLVMLMASVQNF